MLIEQSGQYLMVTNLYHNLTADFNINCYKTVVSLNSKSHNMLKIAKPNFWILFKLNKINQ